MCRFKNNQVEIFDEKQKFQYILCVGSSVARKLRNIIVYHFNTSYVSVQDAGYDKKNDFYYYFNTSYVSVQG